MAKSSLFPNRRRQIMATINEQLTVINTAVCYKVSENQNRINHFHQLPQT